MKIKIINTFKDAEQIWLGLEQEGYRRKVFRAVDHDQGQYDGAGVFHGVHAMRWVV